MDRHEITPRVGWQETVADLGLIWHSTSGQPYWNEAAYYSLSAAEVDAIYAATSECYGLLLDAGEYVINKRMLGRFGTPEWAHGLVREAWEAEPPALNYGRFDFVLGPDGRPKMLEFNCDTPTSLLEASIVQWQWKEDVFPSRDQFNSIDEALGAKWRELRDLLPDDSVHFTFSPEAAGEDAVTVAYMRDVAECAGFSTVQLPIDQVGWDGADFVDLDGAPIRALYKLYPWEWLVNEEFGRNVATSDTIWIEPIWKMIWSNKAILPVLWDMFPGHPNLLATSFDAPHTRSYAKKPIMSREGANITLVRDGVEIAGSGGDYGEEGFVFQDLADLPDFGGNRPVSGSWIVDGEPCGVGIREGGLITDNVARFVPHVIV